MTIIPTFSICIGKTLNKFKNAAELNLKINGSPFNLLYVWFIYVFFCFSILVCFSIVFVVIVLYVCGWIHWCNWKLLEKKWEKHRIIVKSMSCIIYIVDSIFVAFFSFIALSFLFTQFKRFLFCLHQ